jgi:glycosyltransferase involved in cell wall biosynthesis
MNYKRNKPLIITPYSKVYPGGIGTWTRNMMDYSESYGQDTIFNVLFYSNYLISVTNTHIVARVFTGILIYSQLIFKVLVYILKNKPSVLHISSSASISLMKDLMIIWLSKLLNIPTVLHWHFGRIPELALSQNWEWKVLCKVIQKSNYCIVIDNKSLNALLTAGFKNISFIPNPVGFSLEQKSRNLLYTIDQRPQGRLLYVGHIIMEKGVFELVEAISKFTGINELLLVGPYEEKMKEELMELACVRENGSWLRLTGILDAEEVLEQMKKSPILVLPSYTEGFPYVVLEAMAMGCAIIATDVGALPEILAIAGSSQCGICVPVKNVNKLKDAISDLVNDPVRTVAMGKNGIDRVLDNYTLKKVVEQYQNVWRNAQADNSLSLAIESKSMVI